MKLLVTGAWRSAKDNIPVLEEMGHEVIFMQREREALPCSPDWPEGIICGDLYWYHPIEDFINLRYLQLVSVGFDRLNMDFVRENGIEFHNAKGAYSIPMAEFALGGILQLYKQFPFFRENQKRHEWKKHYGLGELAGKAVLIVGCGDVGRECARRFRAFDCRVIGANRTVREEPLFDEIHPLTELDTLLPGADIVILSFAAAPETRHLMNAARLALLKEGAVLVNISRGSAIDETALPAVLPRLCGAVLDVFEEEPLPKTSPLWDAENVILSPHNCYGGDGNAERLNSVIMENIKKQGREDAAQHLYFRQR